MMPEQLKISDSIEFIRIPQKDIKDVVKENTPTLPPIPEIPTIPIPQLPNTYPKISFWEYLGMLFSNEFRLRLISVEKTISNIPLNKDEQSMNDSSILESVKGFVTGILGRWILKIGGGFLLSVGISSDSTLQIVGAIVSIVAGIVISLFQQKQAINTPPPATTVVK
jgi:hypothetical protein